MRTPRWVAWNALVLVLAAGLAQAQVSPDARLRELGEACLRYAADHGGQAPGSLRDLYYQAYVNDLAAFAVPGAGEEVTDRALTDQQSGYALAPPMPWGGPVPVVAQKPVAGDEGAAVACFFSDGTVRHVSPNEVTGGPSAPPAPSDLFPDMPPVDAQPWGPPVTDEPPVWGPEPAADPWEPVRRWGADRVEMADGGPFPAELLLALAEARGIPIASTAPGTVADLLGLQEGDLLVGAGGRPLSSQRDLANVLAETPAQSPLGMAAVRAGVLRVYTVNCGELPQTARQSLARADGAPPTPTPAGVQWPDVALWSRAAAALNAQVMVYDSQESATREFRERTDKGHLDDGSLAEYRYWWTGGQWRMSQLLLKSEAGKQDWLEIEFSDNGEMVGVHHGQDEAGRWRESLYDNDLDGRPESFAVDRDGDGIPDDFGQDADGDGVVD